LPDALSKPDGARGHGARFSRSARLNRRSDYRRVFQRALRFGGRGFSALVRPNGGGPARLGLAISKKCAPRAVDRSRLKRIVRESFRRHRAQLTGLDIVVMCRREAVGLSNARLHQAMAGHWKAMQDKLCASC
jgi:ribonuclease P protein component